MLKHKNGPLVLISIYVFAVFVGLGIGRGSKTIDRIKINDIKLTHVNLFKDGEKQEIKLLGKNSLYMFYVTKGQKEVSIAPIDGNIKLITNLKKE